MEKYNDQTQFFLDVQVKLQNQFINFQVFVQITLKEKQLFN